MHRWAQRAFEGQESITILNPQTIQEKPHFLEEKAASMLGATLEIPGQIINSDGWRDPGDFRRCEKVHELSLVSNFFSTQHK